MVEFLNSAWTWALMNPRSVLTIYLVVTVAIYLVVTYVMAVDNRLAGQSVDSAVSTAISETTGAWFAYFLWPFALLLVVLALTIIALPLAGIYWVMKEVLSYLVKGVEPQPDEFLKE